MLFINWNACAYDFLVFLFPYIELFALKNFEISLTSLGDLARIGGGNLSTLASLSIFFSPLLLDLARFNFGLNLDTIFCMKELLSLSAISESHPKL